MSCCNKSFTGLGFLIVGVCGFSVLAGDSAKGWGTVSANTSVYTEALVDSHTDANKFEALREPTIVKVENNDGLVVQSHLFTECVSKRVVRRR
jgi:hypothetical protein